MVFNFWQKPQDKAAVAFVPKFDDVPVDRLVEIQGKAGPFYVATMPVLEHLGGAYFYGDARHQFYVFVAVCPDKNGVLTARVYGASLLRTRVSEPTLSAANLAIVRDNITLLFKTRDFARPSEMAKKKYLPERILFDWEIFISPE